MILDITEKESGSTISAEIRQITLNRDILVMHRPFDNSQMQQIKLTYNESAKAYENEGYTVDGETVYNIVAPQKIERVRKPRGYWAVDRCVNGICKT
jgi:hypothetical protein